MFRYWQLKNSEKAPFILGADFLLCVFIDRITLITDRKVNRVQAAIQAQYQDDLHLFSVVYQHC